MAKKIRKQTVSLSSYLDKLREEDIRENQDVQRLSGAWEPSMINELIVTVLTDDYIPPIILGEEELGGGLTQLYVVDGLQRGSSLTRFRYLNYKITSAIEDSVIKFQQKKTVNNKTCKDDEGNVIWEQVEFDIKGKTYDDLPKELKKRFNDYQIETVVHQNCTMETLSKLVRRYNNHKSMNAAQRAFTYVDKHARKIRNITDHSFFKECGSYTETEKKNGIYERIVCESVMSMFHIDNWQKQGKKMGMHLNENATESEFNEFSSILGRLEPMVGDDFNDIFNSKNSFIWFTLFYRFTKLGLEDGRFLEFLHEFENKLHKLPIAGFDNMSFDDIDENRATKDKKVIIRKLDILEKLMLDYLQIEKTTVKEISIIDFIRENVRPDVTNEDVECYEEVLEGLTLNVNNSSNLLELQNRKSLIALIAYSFKNDIDLDDWIVDFFNDNTTYIKEQKENYLYMKQDLQNFLERKGK